MNNITELDICAEILVACKFNDATGFRRSRGRTYLVTGDSWAGCSMVDPFYVGANPVIECAARQQADVIEDWLHDKHPDLIGALFADGTIYKTANRTHSEWRKFSIRWCINRLLEKSDER